MVLYLNTHAAIEQLRLSAEAQNIMGPRILIAGATDVGKSTMCKILLNYAARSGRKPLYVDLDVGQSGISLSGAAGAVLIEKPIDIEEGLSSHIPLLYHYGHIQPGENVSLYKSIMTRLASAIHKKMEKDPHSKHSGVIVNSCGWIEGLGFEFLLHAVQAFQIDVVIALDSEKLYYDLKTAIDTKLTSNNDGELLIVVVFVV